MAEKLSWQNVDIATLPPHVQAAWAAIGAAKTNFENLYRAALAQVGAIPTGKDVRISDKWGKLSHTFVAASAGGGGGTFTFPGQPVTAPAAPAPAQPAQVAAATLATATEPPKPAPAAQPQKGHKA